MLSLHFPPTIIVLHSLLLATFLLFNAFSKLFPIDRVLSWLCLLKDKRHCVNFSAVVVLLFHGLLLFHFIVVVDRRNSVCNGPWRDYFYKRHNYATHRIFSYRKRIASTLSSISYTIKFDVRTTNCYSMSKRVDARSYHEMIENRCWYHSQHLHSIPIFSIHL
jgi:hypothetical protein